MPASQGTPSWASLGRQRSSSRCGLLHGQSCRGHVIITLDAVKTLPLPPGQVLTVDGGLCEHLEPRQSPLLTACHKQSTRAWLLQATCRLVEECGFDRVNTAAYSPRPNTPAAVDPDQVGL